jgi:hypothetical protein
MSLFSGLPESRDLSDRLRDAPAVTPSLFSDIISEACWRFPPVYRTERTARIERFIKSDAWTDAALALVELELPQWKVRRIVYDAGEWCCALSRQRELPDWLDQSVETRHADLALAILGAFIDVQRISRALVKASVPAVARAAEAIYTPLACDNFV